MGTTSRIVLSIGIGALSVLPYAVIGWLLANTIAFLVSVSSIREAVAVLGGLCVYGSPLWGILTFVVAYFALPKKKGE